MERVASSCRRTGITAWATCALEKFHGGCHAPIFVKRIVTRQIKSVVAALLVVRNFTNRDHFIAQLVQVSRHFFDIRPRWLVI